MRLMRITSIAFVNALCRLSLPPSNLPSIGWTLHWRGKWQAAVTSVITLLEPLSNTVSRFGPPRLCRNNEICQKIWPFPPKKWSQGFCQHVCKTITSSSEGFFFLFSPDKCSHVSNRFSFFVFCTCNFLTHCDGSFCSAHNKTSLHSLEWLVATVSPKAPWLSPLTTSNDYFIFPPLQRALFCILLHLLISKSKTPLEVL